jgi:hypothetical protein
VIGIDAASSAQSRRAGGGRSDVAAVGGVGSNVTCRGANWGASRGVSGLVGGLASFGGKGERGGANDERGMSPGVVNVVGDVAGVGDAAGVETACF